MRLFKYHSTSEYEHSVITEYPTQYFIKVAVKRELICMSKIHVILFCFSSAVFQTALH